MSLPKHIKEHEMLGIEAAGWPGITASPATTFIAPMIMGSEVPGTVALLKDWGVMPFILPDDRRTLDVVNVITGDNSGGTPALIDEIGVAVWDGITGALLDSVLFGIAAGTAAETQRPILMNSVSLPKYVLVGIAGGYSAGSHVVLDCNFRAAQSVPVVGVPGAINAVTPAYFPSAIMETVTAPANDPVDPIGTLSATSPSVEPFCVMLQLT